MLSAYLDDDLSHQERELVEAAVAADDQVAWRLESLRQTVQLLSNLPDIAPTRSFMLNESMVGDITTARRQAAARRRAQTPATVPALATPHQNTLPATGGYPSTTHMGTHTGETSSGLGTRFRAGWRAFWHGGNPLLRNLATVSLVLTIFVAGADTLLTQPASPASPRAVIMQQEPQAASAPAGEAAAMPDMAADSAAEAEIAASDMTGDTAAEQPGADDTDLAASEPTSEQSAGAVAIMRSMPADDATPATEQDQETEEPAAIAAMAEPALATPALADGATGDAEAGAPTQELAPIEEATIAETTGEEDAGAIDEGGFGDADIAAPLILQGEATGMGSGGDGTAGGMGGGGGGDEPGPRGGGRDGDGTTSSEFVPTTPDPSAAFATGMLTESTTEESLVESATESAPEARIAADDEASIGDAEKFDADEAQDTESSTLAATSLPTEDSIAENSTAGQETDAPVEEAERVAILAAPPAAATETATSAVSAPAPTGQESEQPSPVTESGQPVPTSELGRVLTWIQWGLMVVAATFGLLWWRSRD